MMRRILRLAVICVVMGVWIAFSARSLGGSIFDEEWVKKHPAGSEIQEPGAAAAVSRTRPLEATWLRRQLPAGRGAGRDPGTDPQGGCTRSRGTERNRKTDP